MARTAFTMPHVQSCVSNSDALSRSLASLFLWHAGHMQQNADLELPLELSPYEAGLVLERGERGAASSCISGTPGTSHDIDWRQISEVQLASCDHAGWLTTSGAAGSPAASAVNPPETQVMWGQHRSTAEISKSVTTENGINHQLFPLSLSDIFAPRVQAGPASDWKKALAGGKAYEMPVVSQQPGVLPFGSTAHGAAPSADQQLRLRRRHIVFRDLYDRGCGLASSPRPWNCFSPDVADAHGCIPLHVIHRSSRMFSLVG